MPKDQIKLTLRLPAEIAARFKTKAVIHRRSMHSEIIYALQRYISEEATTDDRPTGSDQDS